MIAHLVARSAADTLEGKVRDALGSVVGTYGLAVLHADFPDRIVIARNGSPLVVGVGDKEMYVASDLAAIVRHTTTVAMLDDGEMATVTAAGFTTMRHSDLSSTGKTATQVDIDASAYDAGDHESFMHKEMLEQPATAQAVLRGRLDDRFGTAHLGGLHMDARDLRAVRRVKILGCGSAYYVGQMGAALIEELARIPADAEAASEFRYRDPVIEPDTLYVAVSQSGETIDTLLAVQEITPQGRSGASAWSTWSARRSHASATAVSTCTPGPRSQSRRTKALTNMFIGLRPARPAAGPGARPVDRRRPAAHRRAASGCPGRSTEILDRRGRAWSRSRRRLAEAESLFFIGRVRGFPVAREGAQKFKEISYRHAEAYQTSELKHGPLALIDPEACRPSRSSRATSSQSRNVGALHEIAARKGPLVVITHAEVDLGEVGARRIDVPRNEPELDPILLTIPLQLLAYHAALHLGHDIDKPRNLAKSVTVE